MVFSSVLFLVYFLPVFLLVYHFIAEKYKNYWILTSSLFFYAWGAPKFIFVVLLSTFTDFYIVRKMYNTTEEKNKKLLLLLSLVLNLGLLAYFKYANFFVDNFNYLLSSLGFNKLGWTEVALPIGISFFIFQSITYAVDVYRGVFPPVKKFSNFILYILCFPQMIAGPIVKYNDIAHQLEERKETIDDKLLGFYRFCIGLAKKVLIANVMAVQANSVFDSDIKDVSDAGMWLGMIAYTFQIYFDFSGYSDMAIGLGRMIGFKFPENFDSPYTSRSITEFWRRWHITLGTFMREYLYIPLGGNRVDRKTRLYFNLALVFILSGLWHGASWNFVIWGAFHGFFLILDRIFLLKLLQRLGAFLSTIITFIIVMFGWVIFRVENWWQLKLAFKKLLSFNFVGGPKVDLEFAIILLVAIFFSFFTLSKLGKRIQNFFIEREEMNLKQHGFVLFISFILFILSLASIASSGFNPFIYFRF